MCLTSFLLEYFQGVTSGSQVTCNATHLLLSTGLDDAPCMLQIIILDKEDLVLDWNTPAPQWKLNPCGDGLI